MIERIEYIFWDWKFRFDGWAFWHLDGWPFQKRCPICAGDGVTNTEVRARYGDEPFKCDRCNGHGFINR